MSNLRLTFKKNLVIYIKAAVITQVELVERIGVGKNNFAVSAERFLCCKLKYHFRNVIDKHSKPHKPLIYQNSKIILLNTK
jgi:hypothetical protein